MGDFFDDFNRKIDKASGEVNISELLTPNFMTTYTSFNNITEFWERSPFIVKTEEDFTALNESELDGYVREVSKFSSWKEMMNKAGELYFKKKLGL